jgi:HSP20 family protein
LARPWESELLDLHRQVDEMFDELVYRPWAIAGRAVWRPPVDVHETADAFLVVIDLPDVDPKDIRLVLGERDVVVAGRRETALPEGILSQRCERPSGPFERTVTLPQAVDHHQAKAEYRHGTCRIHLPKKPRAERPILPLEGSVSSSR